MRLIATRVNPLHAGLDVHARVVRRARSRGLFDRADAHSSAESPCRVDDGRVCMRHAVLMTLTLRKSAIGQPCDTAFDCCGWPLPSLKRRAEPVGALAAEERQRVPEVRRPRLIGDVAQHARPLAVLDLPEHLAAELEVVALLIDRERAVAFDVDAAFVAPMTSSSVTSLGSAAGSRSASAETGSTPSPARARRHGSPRVFVRFAIQRRHVARRLVVHEDALVDDRPRLRRHAFVVPAAGGAAARFRAVAEHVS